MRVAVYYAPDPADPLWPAACTWLGRDPEHAATLPQPPIPGIAELTAAPRLYGFHATLKPPMRLRTSYDQFLADAHALAARTRPFTLPRLEIADLSGFLALRETTPCPPLQALADACVTELDLHRAPPTKPSETAAANTPLTPDQDAMLNRWGYPHVLQTWFFHLTLTRRLDPEERRRLLPAAQSHFAPHLHPRPVTALAIFTQPAPDTPFLIAERLPFG